jgi:tetratricopeptide (TPR) repeat protein
MRLSLAGGLILLLSTLVFGADQFADAAAAFQHGDFSSAETILNNFLQSKPNDAPGLGLLGAVLDSQKKYPEADQVYRRALKIAPNSASLLNNFGNHLLETGHTAEARTTFLKVIALRPGHPNANLQLASISADNKKGVEALHYLNRLPAAEQSAPQIAILRMRALFLCGRNKEANQILNRLAGEAARDPQLSFSTGLALAAGAKYEEAETFFSRTLEAVPGDFDVLYNLGLAAFHAGHSQRAHDVLQTALAARPQDVDTLYNLAIVNINLKQREPAISLLAQAAKLDPARANVQLTLAETLSALGYYADAMTAYENYLKLVPTDVAAQREHAFMISICGRREEGMAQLQAYLHSHPRDATVHYEIAVLEASTDVADAASHLQKALDLQPDFVPARFARGILNYQQGQSTAALPDLEFAAEHFPDNATVLDRLGKTYIDLNRFPDALKVLTKAAELAPQDGRVLLHLSRAFSESGSKEEAQAILARFRAIGPDQAEQVNRVPPAGFAELLSLPPEQLYAQYRAEVESRFKKDSQDSQLTVRYLKLLLEEGETSQSAAVAAHLLSLNPPALRAAEAGRVSLDAGQYAEAKSLLEYAVKSAPTSEVQLDLALALLHTDTGQLALAELEHVQESQRSGDFYLARAQILDSLNKTDEALADLQRALAAAPTRAVLYQEAAMFLVRHQRPGDATRLLDQATRSLPDDRRILLLQAAMFTFARRVKEAERVLKQIQNRWPEWTPAYVTYGILLEGQRRSEEAKNQIDTAIALGASGAQVYFYLAKTITSATPERMDDAAKAISKALALSPGDPYIQALAGRIAYEKHDYDGAVEHLREAVRLQPNYVQAHYTLAQAYRALGRTQDAAHESEQLRSLRQADPDAERDEAIQQFLIKQ